MVAQNWQLELGWVLGSEGGYVDDPRDPGGATDHGITQPVYNSYRIHKGLGVQAVRLISYAEIEEIYHLQYWTHIHGDDLPAGLDYCVFDAAVNSGTVRATIWLQKSLQIVQDGQYGLETAAAVGRIKNINAAIDSFTRARLGFLYGLRTWKFFGRGWARRVNIVTDRAHRLASA